MASEAMAKAVLDHAHEFYDVGNWYVVAECWDLWSVQEELERQEQASEAPFTLEIAAIRTSQPGLADEPFTEGSGGAVGAALYALNRRRTKLKR